jgi:hypothetical protein
MSLVGLLAWAAQPAMAEPAASGSRHDDAPAANAGAPKDGETHVRGHRPNAHHDDARGAPAGANELQTAPSHRVGRKPNVLPQPPHAVSVPIRPHHWPTGVSSGPTRNAIGIAIERRPAKTAPTLHPLWLAAGSTGLPKNPVAGIGAATGSGLVHPGTAVIPTPPRPTGINGTGLTHVGAGPGTIGGAPRTTTGINGTSFRPKHGG